MVVWGGKLNLCRNSKEGWVEGVRWRRGSGGLGRQTRTFCRAGGVVILLGSANL